MTFLCYVKVRLTSSVILFANDWNSGDDLFAYSSLKDSFRLKDKLIAPSLREGGSVFEVISATVAGLIVEVLETDWVDVVYLVDDEGVSACVALLTVEKSEVLAVVTDDISIDVIALDSFWVVEGLVVT